MSSRGEGFFYSPEDQASLAANQRRQAYAQALMEQGQNPGTAQYGGLRSAGNSILGAFLARRSEDKQAELAKSMQDRDTATARALAAQLMQKTPAVPSMQTSVSGTLPQLPGQTAPQPQGPQAPLNIEGRAPQPVLSPDEQLMALFSAQGGPQTQAIQRAMIPQIMGRQEKIWENQQPLAVGRQQEIDAQGQQAQQNALFTNKLGPTAYQNATLAQQRAQLGETRRHNMSEEDVARNPFGTGVASNETGDKFLATLPANIAGQVKAIASYRQSPPASRSKQSMALMAAVNQYNPTYDQTQYGAKNATRTAFAKGKQGDTVRSLNVAVEHLEQLSELSKALGNGDLQLANRIGQAWAQQTGSAAPTNFDATKQIVMDEVVKAVVGAGGGVEDRRKAAEAVGRANSPQQLAGAISQMQGLMAGQLHGLKTQYSKATGLDDFEDFLSPLTKAKLENRASAPIGQGAPHTPTAEEAAAELARRKAAKK